jgi:hypothetical protein
MARRRIAAIGAVALLFAPGVALGAPKVSQTVIGAIDATNVHYRSTLLRVSPVVPHVSWKVIDLNDEIELTNHSSRTVTVYDYDDPPRPYLRILPSGSVELNENSPAYYLNQSFYGDQAAVPASVEQGGQAPDWVTVSKTGSFVWHDHRIHFLSPLLPPVVKGAGVDKTTLVFDWTVPIAAGAVRGDLYGKLVWIAEKPFAFPIAAIIAFVVIVLAGVAFVFVVRRRRASTVGPARPGENW